ITTSIGEVCGALFDEHVGITTVIVEQLQGERFGLKRGESRNGDRELYRNELPIDFHLKRSANAHVDVRDFRIIVENMIQDEIQLTHRHGRPPRPYTRSSSAILRKNARKRTLSRQCR